MAETVCPNRPPQHSVQSPGMMDSHYSTFSSVVLVGRANQAYMFQHYHGQTAGEPECSSLGEKDLKCSPPRQVSLETTSRRDLLFFLSFTPISPSLSTLPFSDSLLSSFSLLPSFVLCLCTSLACHLVLPSRFWLWVFLFFPLDSLPSLHGLCCPITSVTSVHLLPRHSPTHWWWICCAADLCRNNRKRGKEKETCHLFSGEVFFLPCQGIRHISIRSCSSG